MQALPHQYVVTASGGPDENLQVCSTNLPDLVVAAPQQFGGPGDQWSPEDLLMSSVASCFILSFKAIAKGSKLSWLSIECLTEGVLDKVEGKARFIQITNKVRLDIADSESVEQAERILHKAEQSCLVTNSLTSQTKLEYEVSVGSQ